MSLPRYPECKDRGVSWLGSVPEHWAIQRLGYHFVERREKVSDEDFPPLSITRNGVVPQLEHVAKTDDGANRKKVCRGDFVINGRSDRKGSSGASNYDGSCSLINIVLAPGPEIDVRFAHHLMRSVPFQEEFYRYGKGIVADLWSTNFSEMKNISLAVPPVVEQRVIAAFLDRETAKIDALIAEQEKLLALLAEKRQATISHAVTRGLNPKAPMKDSGIPWLGEVPAHWEVTRLKHVTPQITVGIVVEPSKYYLDEGVPALRSLNVMDGTVSSENLVFISTESNDLLVKSQIFAGDIVVVRSGQTGSAAIVPDTFDGANCIDLIIIRKPQDGCEKFLCWFLSSHAAIRQFEGGSEGAIQKHFNIGTAANLVVAWPEPKEQRDISTFLGEELAKLAELEALAGREIELLRERRSALISAAVTGKIDVRGLATKTELA